MSRVKRLTKAVGVVLTDEQNEKLMKITDRLEISVSEFIRNIIQEKIEGYEGGEKDEGR